MIHFNLIDSYRLQNTWGGFTWGRDNPKYISRLDMILMSKILSNKLVMSVVDKFPNERNCSFLSCGLNLNDFIYGREIPRCNATLHKNKDVKTKVKEKLKASIEYMPENWNPRQKL